MQEYLTNKKILLSSGLLLLFLAGGVFFWQTQKKEATLGKEKSRVSQDEDSALTESNPEEGGEPLDDDDPLNTPETNEQARKTSAYVVDQEICANECSVYNKNNAALEYCRAVCGLAAEEGTARPKPEKCDDLNDLAKDVCFRDKAVAEKNQNLCAEVTDQSLRSACYNRIAEELFD
jgi:hypothetical protein